MSNLIPMPKETLNRCRNMALNLLLELDETPSQKHKIKFVVTLVNNPCTFPDLYDVRLYAKYFWETARAWTAPYDLGVATACGYYRENVTSNLLRQGWCIEHAEQAKNTAAKVWAIKIYDENVYKGYYTEVSVDTGYTRKRAPRLNYSTILDIRSTYTDDTEFARLYNPYYPDLPDFDYCDILDINTTTGLNYILSTPYYREDRVLTADETYEYLPCNDYSAYNNNIWAKNGYPQTLCNSSYSAFGNDGSISEGGSVSWGDYYKKSNGEYLYLEQTQMKRERKLIENSATLIENAKYIGINYSLSTEYTYYPTFTSSNETKERDNPDASYCQEDFPGTTKTGANVSGYKLIHIGDTSYNAISSEYGVYNPNEFITGNYIYYGDNLTRQQAIDYQNIFIQNYGQSGDYEVTVELDNNIYNQG